MKKDIHPNTYKIKVSCSCGNSFETLSTIKGGELKVETCQNCHPFYTGEKRLLKTSSVDKFYARQKKAEKLQK
jgi:large subunit ribosomal protein L31